MFSTSEDPTTYEEAAKLKIWREAMESEINAIESNDTWHLTTLPQGAKAKLMEDVYVMQPLGYQKGKGDQVYKLKKALWFKAGPQSMYFLGVEVNQSKQGIFIHQQKYAAEFLKRFGMEDCNKVCSPIVTGYCLAARYMERSIEMHVALVKRIMRYLKGTLKFGMLYKCKGNNDLTVKGWSDSDYAGDHDNRKKTLGYVFTLDGSAICCSSKKRPIVILSTTEAEFVSAASCA
ncbi:copia-type polyprotein, partial [Trifolium pratense]